MKIALFGGSFNPIHVGHIIAVNELLNAKLVDSIWFMPVFKNPLKPSYNIDEKHRINMIKLAIRGIKNASLKEIEIEKKILYTIESINLLKKRFKNKEFYLIIGSDLVKQLKQWKDIERIIKEIRFIIIPIANDDVNLIKNNEFVRMNNAIILENCIKTNICSTEIRKRIREGLAYKHLLPKEVYEYIKKNRLYI